MQGAWRLCQSKQRPKLPLPVQFLSRLLPYFSNPLRCSSMEALTEQTEGQAATACTILVSLFTLFFNPLRCRQHGGSNRANRGPSCHRLYYSCLVAYLILTLCDASMQALIEQTEAHAATTCTIFVLLFNLFFNPLRCRQHGGSFNPLRCRQHGGSARANRGPSCHRLYYSCLVVYLIF
jgi:hypothetical protein